MFEYIFTSESVTEGHPDKVCDLIADSILDAALAQDPQSNMAVEATIKDDFVLVYGEANTRAKLDYEAIALDTIRKIGYTEPYHVKVVVNEQSPEIHNAVNRDVVCAGDQGIMFGFACSETDEYMPAPIYYAHALSRQLAKIRREDDRLRPDGKTQVSVEYKDGKPVRIDAIVVSTQHREDVSQEEIHELVREKVIDPVIPAHMLDDRTKYFINPSGSFVVGGSFGDSGTTGRKIVCDTYGGRGRIGGGCFSSKDPTKVDRSAAYYARWVAKNIVAAGLADQCEVQVSYAIGEPEPVSIFVDTFNTGKVSDEKILEIISRNFNFEVGNILRELDLRRPIYARTTNYGHFGDPDLPWETIKELEL
ncbi:methionine adenosyltransferase [Faecalibaculum rodentium]|uniref:methionine adenosyltransferase n=1 Tax=Faecalibaculum rodentium TaxID=1702221 RepID=UPI0025A5FA37|nr:methionine adenosyltransferase [Faecalibaculum rodentium]